MEYEKFIQPKTVEINGRTFILSKIPALDSLPIHNAVAKCVIDNGMIGLTMLPASVERQIIGYTAIDDSGVKIVPNTDRLIGDIFNGRVADLKKLVVLMVRENFDFLINGDLLDLLSDKGEAPVSVS